MSHGLNGIAGGAIIQFFTHCSFQQAEGCVAAVPPR
jgi:hypothetical protein